VSTVSTLGVAQVRRTRSPGSPGHHHPAARLGYGEFVFESAGQEQALRTVNYLGRSNELFAVLSNELFGEHGIASSRRRRRPRSTED